MGKKCVVFTRDLVEVFFLERCRGVFYEGFHCTCIIIIGVCHIQYSKFCFELCVNIISLVCVCLHFTSDSVDVCRQCMECGIRHGQHKRTREIITWLKKKKRVIRREELLAFLLDKPYPQDSPPPPHFDRAEDFSELQPSFHSHLSHHHAYPRSPQPPPPSVAGLSFSANMPVPLSVPLPMASASCFNAPLSSPRGRRTLFGREEPAVQSDGELFAAMRENGRKRLNSFCSASTFECSQDSPPLAKRMKI